MEWCIAPGSYQQAFEMACCFFTMMAALLSYVVTMRF